MIVKTLFLALTCFTLSISATFSQNETKEEETGLFVFDYEKINEPFYNCELFVCTENGGAKSLAVEIRGIFVYYPKEKVKEWISGIQAVIDSKTGKTKNGKRTSIFILSDGNSSIYFNEKGECLIKFGPTDRAIITQDSARKIMEGFKMAYEKL